jgi:hypothetical protein
MAAKKKTRATRIEQGLQLVFGLRGLSVPRQRLGLSIDHKNTEFRSHIITLALHPALVAKACLAAW